MINNDSQVRSWKLFVIIVVVLNAPCYSFGTCIETSIQLSHQADVLIKNQASITEAIDLYEKANLCFYNTENWESYIHNSIAIAVGYAKNGDTTTLSRFDEIFDIIYTQLNGIDSLVALAFHKKGVACYTLYDDLNAIKNYQEALNIRLKYLPSRNQNIINGYRNIGECFYYLNQQDSARFYLRACLLYTSPSPRD